MKNKILSFELPLKFRYNFTFSANFHTLLLPVIPSASWLKQTCWYYCCQCW